MAKKVSGCGGCESLESFESFQSEEDVAEREVWRAQRPRSQEDRRLWLWPGG